MFRNKYLSWYSLLLVLLASQDIQAADIKKIGSKHFSPMRASFSGMKERGFFATGLQVQYPGNADCPKADSLFADTTRGDGSSRSDRFFNGYHGGIDIPVAEGTPILAIADGMVVHKKEGANIGGIGMILQHTPQDTGTDYWIYSEYKHLVKLPDMEIGQRVNRGQQIALAGKSGTIGGYYGDEGHSHLHLTTWFSADDKYSTGKLFFPPNGYWADPLAIFKQGPIDSGKVRELPDDQKKVAIPYKTTSGEVFPAGSKLVWPFVCRPH